MSLWKLKGHTINPTNVDGLFWTANLWFDHAFYAVNYISITFVCVKANTGVHHLFITPMWFTTLLFCSQTYPSITLMAYICSENNTNILLPRSCCHRNITLIWDNNRMAVITNKEVWYWTCPSVIIQYKYYCCIITSILTVNLCHNKRPLCSRFYQSKYNWHTQSW